MHQRHSFTCFLFLLCLINIDVDTALAEDASLTTTSFQPRVEIFPLPGNASFLEGSNFEVPIFINTKGSSINGIDLSVKYDPTKMKIVNPSGGKSIIGVWAEAPYFDNTKGVARFVGVIPGGIKTTSGLIAIITFKGIAPGNALFKIQGGSSVLLNDGEGSDAILDTQHGSYSIVTRPAEGLSIYSETHPVQSEWYNNENVSLIWDQRNDVSKFSFALDNEPKTVPTNTLATTSTSAEYDGLSDGVWYFHVKMERKGVWGAPSHRIVRIDTEAPAQFVPSVELFSKNGREWTQISFATTDAMSGIDHYEVGVIDSNQTETRSPVFIETESPYILPENITTTARVYVRAMDKAGNVRDVYIDVKPLGKYTYFFKEHIYQVLTVVLFSVLLLILGHLFLTHRYILRIKRAVAVLEKDIPGTK